MLGILLHHVLCHNFCYKISCLSWVHLRWHRLSFWVVLYFFATPIPCTAESFARSLSCISVASADRTTTIAFSRVRSEIPRNLSLFLVSLMSITILCLITEFFNVPNWSLTQPSQHSIILINGVATFLGFWKKLTFFLGSQYSSSFPNTLSIILSSPSAPHVRVLKTSIASLPMTVSSLATLVALSLVFMLVAIS